MDKTGKVIAAIMIFAIVGAGVAFALTNDGDESEAPSTNQPSTNEREDAEAEVAATITYTNDGFSVGNSVIQTGDSVRVINQSDDALDFSSDPHPVHTDQAELNVGVIDPGESQAFTITQTGEWGFHNHLRDAHSGRITVK